MHRRNFFLAGVSILLSANGMSQWFGGPNDLVSTLPASYTNIEVRAIAQQEQGHQLRQMPNLSFEQASRKLLKQYLRHPLLNMAPAASQFNLSGTLNSQTLRLRFGPDPFCNYSVRSHQLMDGSILLLGQIPEVSLREPALGPDWPDKNDALDQAMNELTYRRQGDSQVKVLSTKRCVHATGGSVYPVWQFLLEKNQLPYQVVADAYEVIEFKKAFFNVDGTATIHENHILDGTSKEFTLTGLTGDGTLTSEFIKTTVPATYTRAVETSHTFTYGTDDRRYDEAAAYTYVQRHYDFMKTIGFTWYGPKPIDVRLHERPNNQTNNALFLPSFSSSSLPTIKIGDGDGKALANLSNDADVVAHEFGHHVVYKYLKDTAGESLVVHEGLADFFAFARSGDSCLGESICPESSTACWVPGKCLRSGETTLRYDADLYQRVGGHFRGQVLSGMLWDMRKGGVISADALNQLVIKAVEFLPESTTIRQYLLSLFTADEQFHASKYKDHLVKAAEDRGMASLVSDIKGGSPIPLPTDEPAAVAPPESPSTDKKNSSKSGWCAIALSGQTGSATGVMILMVVLLLPLILPAWQRQPIRGRKKDDQL